MNLIELVNVLEAAGVGTRGTTIFAHTMPSACGLGVLLRGKFTGTKIDYELPGFYKTDIMLVVRSSNYAAGDALMLAATAALTLTEANLVSYHVKYCRPEALPAVYPLSDGGNMEFAVRLNIAFYKK